MEEQKEMQIFLSYASPDQQRVLQIYDFLVRHGYPNTWIDCKKLLPGAPWEFEILRNLRKSDLVIFFLSNVSVNKRGFVQKELKIILRYLEEKLIDDTYIIPVKLDSDAIVPDELNKIQWVDINASNAYDSLKRSIDIQAAKLNVEVLQDENELDDIRIVKKSFKEKWEGLPGYDFEFSIPVFYATKFNTISEISKIVEGRFISKLHEYRHFKLWQEPEAYNWAQNEFRRTNVFDAQYSDLYHDNSYLGFKFNIYWYGAGAAHPNTEFMTYNFLLNPLVEISDLKTLFKNQDYSFKKIVEFARNALLEIPNSDNDNPIPTGKLLNEEGVMRGTKDWNSFSAFVFSKVGLELYFSAYQVGCHATGSHQISVPYEIIESDLYDVYQSALGIKF